MSSTLKTDVLCPCDDQTVSSVPTSSNCTAEKSTVVVTQLTPPDENNVDALTPKDSPIPVAATGTRADIVLEAGAELVGTLVFVGFGTGGNCQYAVTDTDNTYSTVPVGWGMGLALGHGLAARFSGGHVNPAVTLMLALTGRLPYWKVPIYWLAQLIGAFLGAAITYGVYFHDIGLLEGGPQRTIAKTAGLFGTYPGLDTPTFSCWLAEFFPATILLSAVLYMVSMKDRPAFGAVPLVLFITVLGIGCTFGSTTSFSINPARDLGPRLLTYAVGYGSEVWTYKNEYWIWGGQLGAYSAAVFVGLFYRTYKLIGLELPGAERPVEVERIRIPRDAEMV